MAGFIFITLEYSGYSFKIIKNLETFIYEKEYRIFNVPDIPE